MSRKVYSGKILVRLSENEKQGILNAVDDSSRKLGFEWEEIGLFGSRSELATKGGDLDLYIKIKPEKKLDLFKIKARLRTGIHDFIGEQKLDILLDDTVSDLGAFGKLVLNQKVILWTKK